MMRLALALLTSVILPVGAGALLAQDRSFPEPLLLDYGLQAARNGSVDFGDFDDDGDLDLLLAGDHEQGPVAKAYRLDRVRFSWTVGETVFFDTTDIYRDTKAVLLGVSRSSARWGDYDNDDDLDILLTGLAEIDEDVNVRVQQPVTLLYENRDGQFIQNQSIGLPAVFNGAVAWGDYDNDGDPDLLMTGATSITPPHEPVSYIFRNDGGRFVDINAGLPGLMFSAAAWGDYDNDGDLDLAVQGVHGEDLLLTRLYRNDGNDRFTDSGIRVPPLAFGSLDWGDYDSDGDLDLLVAGGTLDPGVLRGVTRIYRNDGGMLTDSGAELPGILFGSARFGDFDNDGVQDVALAGSRQMDGVVQGYIYLYRGGNFVPAFSLGALTFSDISVGDYNADGDLDIALIGAANNQVPFTQFYQNRLFPESNLVEGATIVSEVPPPTN